MGMSAEDMDIATTLKPRILSPFFPDQLWLERVLEQ